MLAWIRRVGTASGATAVQIAESVRGRRRIARHVGSARDEADRLDLLEGPGAKLSPRPVDAVLSIGARHLWGENDSSALTALRSLIGRGGRVVYGDGIWRHPPTPATVEPLGGDPGAYGTLADLVDAVVATVFRVIDVAEASLEEWDAIECGYSARYERWLLDHLDHPSAADIHERTDRPRSAYLRGCRGVFGHSFFQLVAA